MVGFSVARGGWRIMLRAACTTLKLGIATQLPVFTVDLRIVGALLLGAVEALQEIYGHRVACVQAERRYLDN